MDGICKHIEEIKEIKTPTGYKCEECMKTGGHWVHLRTCQTCGVTLCCDTSPAKHMTQHFKQTGHPVVISAEPDDNWLWCYEDESFVRYT